MNKTKIEWVKNPDGTQGYTWNPITGCLNHINGICKGGNFPCYAYRLAHGRLKERYLANRNKLAVKDVLPGGEYLFLKALADPFYPRIWSSKILEPIVAGRKGVKPKGIFVCDMSDLFGIGIPEKWTEYILNTIKASPEHRFYLLTKQPQNLPKWFPNRDEGGHSNCWVGSTITHDGMMDATVKAFDDLWAPIRYISFEPLLGRLSKDSLKQIRDSVCQWLIIGAQTKPYKPPKIEWVQEIVEAADRADTPVFLKNNLIHLFVRDSKEAEIHTFQETFVWALNNESKLRQEFPK